MADDWLWVDLANDGCQRLGELEQRRMDHPTCEYHTIESKSLLTIARAGNPSTSLLS